MKLSLIKKAVFVIVPITYAAIHPVVLIHLLFETRYNRAPAWGQFLREVDFCSPYYLILDAGYWMLDTGRTEID